MTPFVHNKIHKLRKALSDRDAHGFEPSGGIVGWL